MSVFLCFILLRFYVLYYVLSLHYTSSVSLHYLVKCQRITDRAIGQWRRRLECVVRRRPRKVDTLNI